MKNCGLLICLLFSSALLFAQNVPDKLATKFDLTFFTPHYRIHCVTASGVCINKDGYSKMALQQAKDTVIGLVYKSKTLGGGSDSIIIKYPFKEKLDSTTLHVVDNEGKRMPLRGVDLIFIDKQNNSKVVSCTNGISNEANELFKNGKAGDQIIFRNIRVSESDGTSRSINPLEITLK